MNNEKCPLCHSALFSDKCEAVPYRSEFLSSDVPKKIIYCQHCGLGIAKPLPSEESLDRLYKESNFWAKVEPVVSPRKHPIFPALARSRWSLIQSHLGRREEKWGGLKVLDIGAGFGYLGIVAVNAPGVAIDEYCAVEPDLKVRSALEKVWPERCNKGILNTFSELGQVKGKYDVIALSHVLEHVSDPSRMIGEVIPLMSEDALVFFDVPNRDELFKRDVFPHLLFFSVQSLRMLMEKANLTVIDLDTWGNPREKTSLNSNVSGTVKIWGKVIGRLVPFMPVSFTISMLSMLFQVNARHERGTWVRALAVKQVTT